ncbi:MAG TPA: cytochrome c peroxidase [Candidatus Binatia bacterium]|nr:cytochrome c peroxidase [Candidatus Binatia bacterium]
MSYRRLVSILAVVGGLSFLLPILAAQGTPPPPITNFQLPPGYQVPPADQQCILSGNRLNLQCIIANDPDLKRVRAEEAQLEANALASADSGKLDPYHQVQTLGALEIFDPTLSVNSNVACSYCHDPMAGYANGASILSVYTGGSNPGSVAITVPNAYPNNRIAKRNPQSYAYSPYYPRLHYNTAQADFYGGNFWDGRATGYKLQNSAAEQAQDPPSDPEEMANPDPACVVWKISQGKYVSFFETVFGAGSITSISWPSNVASVCSTPKGAAIFGNNATPLNLSTFDRTLATVDFDEFAQAIAAYESSSSVSPFTSKFDYWVTGVKGVTLTAEEQAGYDLFRGKGSCNTCHLDGRSSTQLGGTDTGAAADVRPLFTDTTYNNLGLPKNVIMPWYSEDTPDQWGFTGNPLGFGFTDEGMGLFLDGYYGAPPDLDWGVYLEHFEGKFQTSTARDAAQVPYPGFVKAFMHNGYLTSLKEVVHFYNTRDVYHYNVLSGSCPEGTVEKVTCWPEPEDENNINTTIGKLGLTDEEENEIVAFLGTLVDGYKP